MTSQKNIAGKTIIKRNNAGFFGGDVQITMTNKMGSLNEPYIQLKCFQVKKKNMLWLVRKHMKNVKVNSKNVIKKREHVSKRSKIIADKSLY